MTLLAAELVFKYNTSFLISNCSGNILTPTFSQAPSTASFLLACPAKAAFSLEKYPSI